MSLRFRVNLAISLIGVVFIVVTTYILIDYKRRSISEEIDAGTRVAAQLLESITLNPLAFPQSSGSLASLSDYLRSVGRVRANEVRLFDANHVLVYESPPSAYKQGRDAPRWFSAIVAPKIAEVRLALPVGEIVITPDASRSVLDAWDELNRFGLLILLFFALLNLAVFRLLGRSLQPLKGILRAMSEMEHGNLASRLPDYPLPEFNAIGHTFNRMAANLEEALAQNERLALIVQQSSDAIMVRDLDGKFSFCNPAAEHLLGFSRQEIVGRTVEMIVPQEALETWNTVHTRGLQDREIQHLETRLKKQGGELVEVAMSMAPLLEPGQDALLGEIFVIRDMTEHRQRMAAEMELEQNRKFTQLLHVKLEEERKAIARELHDELGQCVTAIKTIGTAIANRAGEAQAENRRNAETIVEVASHIYDVVHSIIRQLRPSALDHLGLADAIADVVSQFRRQHPELEVELSLHGDLNQYDEKRNITVYRVVQECLTNAAKHAQASRVSVEVTVHTGQGEADTLEVRVSDNGKGLNTEISESRRFGFLGMRERVQAFGGEVTVESGPDKGTQVIATLPMG
ncbi:MAG: PAS domain S-box protein [Pseudomonadales bacterium]|nr:PAS domain S-box protein [Pseudomonadales bacterium]MCP5329414.1 PAS domain S-box protein [Pseudomonadales bacterium]MCP5344704.1 PAS domain S-box protein [Pseudomonadales bacterium]